MGIIIVVPARFTITRFCEVSKCLSSLFFFFSNQTIYNSEIPSYIIYYFEIIEQSEKRLRIENKTVNTAENG